MHLDKPMADRQPQSRALGLSLALQPIEGPKDTLFLVRWDAGAVVLNVHADAVGCQASSNFDAPPAWGELDSVSHQIGEHLTNTRRIGTNGQRPVHLLLKALRFLLRQWF